MGIIYDAFKQAWPFGPSSNPAEPNKADIHNAGATIDREVVGAAAGLVRGELWVTLNAIAGTRNGQPGEVPTTDGGTHTDPVAGGTVPNQGEYRWSSSPVGWRRIGDYRVSASDVAVDLSEETDARILADGELGDYITAVNVEKNTMIAAEAAARVAKDVEIVDDLNVTNEYVSDHSDALAGLTPAVYGQEIARPGDATAAWSSAISGLPKDRVRLPDSLVTVTNDGRVVRVIGQVSVAPRAMHYLDRDRKYAVRFGYRRPQDVLDPAGAAVQCVFSWLTQSGAPAGTPLTVGHNEVPTVGAGRRTVTIVIASVAGPDVDVVWPAGAVYCTPFVQTFDADAVTDVEMIDWDDITDVGGYSPDLTSLTARVGAIESADLPDRVATLESASTAPGRAGYATRADAIAATIPASVKFVEVSAYSVSHPVVVATFIRAAGSTPGGWQNVADSQWWALSDAEVQLEMFGAKGDADLVAGTGTNDQAAYNNALALGRPIELRKGSNYLVTDPTNSLGITVFGDGRLVKAVPGGYAQHNSKFDLSPVQFRAHLHAVKNLWIGNGNAKVVLFGDSTLTDAYGLNVGPFVADTLRQMGLGVKEVLNESVAGKSWADFDIAAKLNSYGEQKHLAIIKLGTNNAGGSPTTLETAREQLRNSMDQRLGEFRASPYGSVANLSILLILPNALGNTATNDTNKNNLWNEMIDGVYLEAALKHQCATCRDYQESRNAQGGANLWLDAELIHPQVNYNIDIIGRALKETCEPFGSIKRNALVFKTADEAMAPSVSTGLSGYDRGISQLRVSAAAIKTSTVTMTIASPGVISWTAHGLAAGTGVKFTTTGALPTGLVAGTMYYVVNPTTNTFSVAAAPGGTAINTTGSQSGTHTATADEWPFTGFVTTSNHPDNISWQQLDAFQLGYARSRRRQWITGSNVWSAWSGDLNDIVLGTNIAASSTDELPRYWRNLDGDVCVAAMLQATANIAVDAVIGALPSGFRPPRTVVRIAFTAGGTPTPIEIRFLTNGNIVTKTAISNGTFFVLENCTFRAA